MRRSTLNRRQLMATLAALTGGYTLNAHSQASFPSKPIKIILPFPPGGGGDTAVRMVSKALSDAFGQQVIVDNKPGGDGVIAGQELLRSPPDGHTLMFGTATPLIYTPLVKASKPPYDPLVDFAPVSTFSGFTYYMHVHESVPAKSLQEFIDYVRKNPGKVAYGTGDATSIVTMAQIQLHTKLDMTHVPYKGGGQALIDFAAGRIQVLVGLLDMDVRMQGKSRPLAVLQAKRSAQRPEVQSFPELGYPQVNLLAWTAFFAPGKTPQPIVDKLSATLVKVFSQPDLREAFAKFGNNLEGSSPEFLGNLLKNQIPAWKEAIQFAKIPVE
jgi:tripartite-type tricarboxylate transporter receptor subunit TctC